jgi:hypothetical protein
MALPPGDGSAEGNMPTIGRTHTGPRPNRQRPCAVCGVVWLESDLTTNANGSLVCEDDREGRTELEVDMLIAEGE